MNKKIRFFQSIHFKIAIIFILLLLATIEIIGAFFVRQLEQQNVDNFETSIQVPAYINNQLAEQLSKPASKTTTDALKSIISDYGNSNITQVQVIDSKGIIRSVSNGNSQDLVGQRSTNTDVKEAEYTGRKYSRAVADNQHGRMLIQITPINSTTSENNGVVGVLYVQAGMSDVYRNIQNVTLIFLTASLVAAVLGGAIALFIARAITGPIDEMKKQAIKMANGDYSGQVKIYGNDELGQLAEAVNNLSVRVEEAQDSTESERRRLDNVLANMTDGVIATDRHGNITIINEMALDFFDRKEDDNVIGQTITEFLNINDEYTVQDLYETEHEVIVDVNAGTSKELILHANFSIIQRVTGFVSGLVCVLHDVTEQQKNEREQREFVSNVSHELRTPLTSLKSYIDALSDGAWQDPEIAPQFLEVTQEETERMIRMINDLLNLSRIDRGTANLELEWINLNSFFNYVLNRFDMMINQDNSVDGKENSKKYSIKREFTGDDLWVEIDTDKMTQVLDNIMNNAIKYSPDGGVITARLIKTHNHVIMSVSDQGLGIPRKDLYKIFDRFYRVDKARSRMQGGTGLGLAISKEVVEAHHGRIWADSAEGRGSTFYISLPYDPMAVGGDWDEF